jgi:hypothetical protein
MWQYVQLGQWQQLIARCVNVERALFALGAMKESAAKAAEESGAAEQRATELAAADELYRQALGVARAVGSAQPNLFITVSTGIDLMEDAYAALLRTALATGSAEAQKWDGESGVVAIGRQYLYGALKRYEKRRSEDPPPSIPELLELEAELVRETVLGIGLRPAGSAKRTEAEARATPPS